MIRGIAQCLPRRCVCPDAVFARMLCLPGCCVCPDAVFARMLCLAACCVWPDAVFGRMLCLAGCCVCLEAVAVRRSRLILFFSRSKLASGSELTRGEHRRDFCRYRRDFCRYLRICRSILFPASIKDGYEPTGRTFYITFKQSSETTARSHPHRCCERPWSQLARRSPLEFHHRSYLVART
jgi:hypothetical protein